MRLHLTNTPIFWNEITQFLCTLLIRWICVLIAHLLYFLTIMPHSMDKFFILRHLYTPYHCCKVHEERKSYCLRSQIQGWFPAKILDLNEMQLASMNLTIYNIIYYIEYSCQVSSLFNGLFLMGFMAKSAMMEATVLTFPNNSNISIFHTHWEHSSLPQTFTRWL